VGYKYTLVLSREITDDESAILREASPGCAEAVFGADTLPTNAEIPVTKMDVDDTVSPTLAEAIQAGLDAVKKVPELGIPGLTVPAQPAGPVDADKPSVVAGEKPEVLAEEKLEPAKPAAKKPAARKPRAKKAPSGEVAAEAKDPVEAGAAPA
jgi:hypothetical protein